MIKQANTKVLALWAFFLLGISIASTFFAYFPGLNGPFLFDDFPNLQPLNRNGGVSSISDAMVFILGNESGSLGRPISMLSFLLNDNAWPSASFSYKYTNLMLHLVNGLLLFYLSFRLILTQTEDRRLGVFLAAFVCSAWLANPFNVSTVLYVIQRMAQLSTLFALLAMNLYLVGRLRIQRQASGGYFFIVFLVPCLCLLSILSKENGVLVFLFIIFLEFIFFHELTRTKRFTAAFRIFYVAPLMAFLVYLVSNFDRFADGYRYRDFSMYERLLTQPRVLVDYTIQTLGLKSIGGGIFHDDFLYSSSLVQPLSTFLAAAFWIVVICVCVLLRRKAPLIAFGGGVFLIGHSLEASFIPLEMYFEHRNYLPMCGIFIALAGFLLKCIAYSRTLFCVSSLLLSILYVPGGLAVTHQSASLWGNDFDLYTMWATEHPGSLRAQRHYGGYLGRTELWAYEAMDILHDSYQLHPESVSLPIKMLVQECRYGYASGVTIKDISSRLQNNEENGAVVIALQELADAYFEKGCEVGASEVEIAELLWMAALESSLRRQYKAKILFILVEFYKKNGNLDRTIAALDAISKLDSSYAPALQKGYFLYTAGLYEDALLAVKDAYVKDRNRKKAWLYSSNSKSIESLENLIMMEITISTQAKNHE